MPIPFLIVGAAALFGAIGVGAAVDGINQMSDAKETCERAKFRHDQNVQYMKEKNVQAGQVMDDLGKYEVQCVHDFSRFGDLIERIQNRPDVRNYKIEDVDLPKYDNEELKDESVGAGILLGGAGGAALGTFGGFAAAGVTTATVTALGTASTGTAIASLSGAAATNATLAVLGGGTLAAGGGGVALGTVVLGASTLGIGLLVGGIVFNFAGSSLSDKADEAWNQMLEAERAINKINKYLDELHSTAVDYNNTVIRINKTYKHYYSIVKSIVDSDPDANNWSESELQLLENMILLFGLLHKACQVAVVLQKDNKNKENREINYKDIHTVKEDSQKVFAQIA